MTKEQAIQLIKSDGVYSKEVIEALEDAEGDCISRQAVLDIMEKEGHKWGNDYRDWVDAIEEIKNLPPVNPQEIKTGQWRAIYQGDEIIDYRCSECEFGSTFGKSTYRMNYCPNCGAKMQESEEV